MAASPCTTKTDVFFRSKVHVIEFVGEKTVGSLIDPSAMAKTNRQQFDFMTALEDAANEALGGPYEEKRGEEGPSWSALMDDEYPLNLLGEDGALVGNWGTGRMA